ncbi:MAG TPA: acetyl-CoA carboxylase biotin carboxylase subunit [Actinomycetota bacterium]|nr:acetyl-CoA carboxylase biotin carboxylase subunit [Actinomycetota bacterium]
MFSRLLIANRGEIAIRVIRACRDLGVTSIAVYSDADRDARHVALADEAFHIGDSAPAASYLNIEKILETARAAGAEAVHPGYGFLSENADFVRACTTEGIVFVGPPADAMDSMGDKISARKVAEAAQAPFVPGTLDAISDIAEVYAFGKEHGFPIAIKAAFGGGGRGFKVIRKEEEVEEAVSGAQREAKLAFGRDEIYIERYLSNARHIEAQILADTHGNVLFMGERECSLQRRHQKLVEESPSVAVSDEVRARIAEASAAVARQVGYVNAGTVEYMLDEDKTRFYFMEMNTRLQVEHPVTELCTGIDLCAWQIRIAAGERLPWKQEDIKPRGHAIEVRINAEDPSKGRFLPAPGRIGNYIEPTGPGVRVDSGFGAFSEIPRNYDSLIAKLITYGADRDEARRRMLRALEEYTIEGVKTLIPFHKRMLADPNFITGDVHTAYVEKEMDLSDLVVPAPEKVAEPPSPGAPRSVTVEVDGKRLEVAVHGLTLASSTAATAVKPAVPVAEARAASGGAGTEQVRAPMQGTIVKCAVKEGDEVKAGDLLVVLEAMKMENHINAPRAGTVEKLAVQPGQNVETNAVVVVIT